MITAIILHYYTNRTKYIGEIVDALNTGEVKPDKIIIWNNNSADNLSNYQGSNVSIINSGVNLGCGIRHLIALAFQSDYYFFQDDDLVVKPETLKNMVDKIKETGHIIGAEYYAAGIVLGRIHLCNRDHLVSNQDFLRYNALPLPFRVDDISLSLANRKQVDLAHAPFENLPEEGQGLSHQGGHSKERREYLTNYDK